MSGTDRYSVMSDSADLQLMELFYQFERAKGDNSLDPDRNSVLSHRSTAAPSAYPYLASLYCSTPDTRHDCQFSQALKDVGVAQYKMESQSLQTPPRFFRYVPLTTTDTESMRRYLSMRVSWSMTDKSETGYVRIWKPSPALTQL